MQVDEASEAVAVLAEIEATKAFWWTKKAAYAVFGLLLVYSIVRSLVAAATRTLWFDEILTWAVSTQGWSHIVKALLQGADAQPPFFYAIEHRALQITGSKEIALRLPSILAFPCTLACVFAYARRRAGEIAALACVMFLLATAAFQVYAAQARPYSIVVACFAFALVCYQRIANPYWAIAMGAAVTLAESMHYCAVFSLLPFGIAEMVYVWRERKIRWRAWGAMTCALLPLALSWPIFTSLRAMYGSHYWSRYGASSVAQTFGVFMENSATIGNAIAVICVLLVIRACFLPPKPPLGKGRDEPDWVDGTLMIALMLLPLTTLAITKILHGVMHDRYVLPSVLGMALAIRCIRSVPKWIGIIVVACCALILCIHEVAFWQSVQPRHLDKPAAQLEDFVRKGGHSDLPVAVSDAMLFLPLEVYASPESKNRFVYLVDEQKAVRYVGSDNVDKNLVVLRAYLPFSMPDFSGFVQEHRVFLLYAKKQTPTFDWLSRYLPSIASSMEVLNEDTNRTLYLVRMR